MSSVRFSHSPRESVRCTKRFWFTFRIDNFLSEPVRKRILCKISCRHWDNNNNNFSNNCNHIKTLKTITSLWKKHSLFLVMIAEQNMISKHVIPGNQHDDSLLTLEGSAVILKSTETCISKDQSKEKLNFKHQLNASLSSYRCWFHLDWAAHLFSVIWIWV